MKFSFRAKRFLANFTRKKENKFDYVISLGYNCEVAFRFLRYFKGLNSNLFNWCGVLTIDELLFAIKNFDLIGSGDFYDPKPLWQCKNTNILFHGDADCISAINDEAKKFLENDKKNLIGRINHLKEKFLKIAQSDKSKLYVYKVPSNCIDENTNSKMEELNNALQSLCNGRVKLLVVSEEKYKEFFKPNGYLYRTVKFFAPDGNVLSKDCMENGWHDIWHEFCQTTKFAKKKSYKFDRIKNFFNTKFDLVFGMGEVCSCSINLRSNRLQFWSYPYDWVGGKDLGQRVDLLVDRFKDWFNKEDFIKTGENNVSAVPKDVYTNTKTTMFYNHDFKKGVPFDEMFPIVKERYERRIKRLYSQIENSKNVLLVFIQIPTNKEEVSAEKLLEISHKLRTNFPNANFKLLYFFNVPNKTEKTMRFLTDNICKIDFDYNGYDKEFPGVLKDHELLPIFYKIKVTSKFMTFKNRIKRIRYKIKKGIWLALHRSK